MTSIEMKQVEVYLESMKKINFDYEKYTQEYSKKLIAIQSEMKGIKMQLFKVLENPKE